MDEITVDIVVVGSGAGGMTAALCAADQGANTLLIEKSPYYGGSSAMSGGCVWVPNHHLMAESGIADCEADSMRYLEGLVGEAVEPERLRACVEAGPKMVRFLQEQTDVVFRVLTYPDYYPDAAGAKDNGRTLDVAPLSGRALGPTFYEMRELHPQMVFGGNFALTFAEAKQVMHQKPGWKSMMLKRATGYFLDVPGRLRGRRDRRACLGGSLVARLRSSMVKRNIPLKLKTGFSDLLFENGEVCGIEAREGERSFRIKARQGVILAAGGFEHNRQLRQRYLPAPTDTAWSTANPDNTGDVLVAGLRHNLGTAFLDDAWWGPTNPIPGQEHGVAFMFVTERCAPGSLIVNQDGVRVVNEAAPYPDIVRAMYETSTQSGAPSVPLFLLVDAAFRRRSALGPILPGEDDGAVPKNLLDSEYFTKADSLGALATQNGIDATALEATVSRFNQFCTNAQDEDFGRGDNAYDRYWADSRHGPNPCLGPLSEPPYYALKLYPGDIGTRGGIQADAHARVLDQEGSVVPRLYAVGNCAAPVYGNSYPGAGSTIGPAMTFGYLAGRHAAELPFRI